ncbi:DsbA family protein [Streptomyces sp. NPDC059618]|uniref:DsbA family protein n=1 Tax=Streptomyces sp. NPDC059618 TaxID=3346887 RepID=UPI0036920242
MSTPTRNPTPANSSTSGTTSRKAKNIVWVVLAAVVVAGVIAGVVAVGAARNATPDAAATQAGQSAAQWGEATEDKSPVFRGYAEELGLDMAAYDKAVADPATRARVEADVADGIALGVQGTPTFFLDGEMLTLTSLEQFRAEVDAAASN